jgi:hypothetical protein
MFQITLWDSNFWNVTDDKRIMSTENLMKHIVAYRPVAKQWLCKQRPFLGSGSVNTFPLLGRRFLIMQQLDYNNGRTVFSMWSMPRCYNWEVWSVVSLVEFFTGGCEERTWVREAEESPLLEAIAREWLVKTQQAGKWLSRCCGDLWIVEISGGNCNCF